MVLLKSELKEIECYVKTYSDFLKESKSKIKLKFLSLCNKSFEKFFFVFRK